MLPLPRLGDRLKLSRHRQFVGRELEKAFFQAALTGTSPTHLLYIFGPGGIGKTALLGEFLWLCEQNQIPALYLDARRLEPSPAGLRAAIGQALNLSSPEAIFEYLAGQPTRFVILLDTYEMLNPLDGWLRQEFLPQLSDNVLFVLAGREAPTLPWRTDPGWQTLIQTLPLRNLSPDESCLYLTQRDIPSEEQPAILGFTHGHPLALCLVADVFAQRDTTPFQPEERPDILQILLEQFVQKTPDPAHRAALEVCALVHLTTEALLAEMLKLPDVHGLFHWLRELSFIESQPGGLSPHDIVREILMADLRWRNPKWYIELLRRARACYLAQVHESAEALQPQLLFDYAFLHRYSPIFRPYLEWQMSSNILIEAMHQTDIADLTAMAAVHEGEDSARLAAYWFARQPEAIHVFRDLDQRPIGFVAALALERLTEEDLATDPVVRQLWRYLCAYAPLEPGQRATYYRFWMGRDTYQTPSPAQSLTIMLATQQYLTTPNLAFSCYSCADPAFWEPLSTYTDFARIPAADFQLNGRLYGAFGHDWRVLPPLNWLALMSERDFATYSQPQELQPVIEPLLALNQSEFQMAIRAALRDMRQEDSSDLQANPLLQSRLISQRVGPQAGKAERSAALQTVLREAADSLLVSPRDLKFYRALHHTYFQPAPTQEQAASLLNLPFSTFRRHLETGVRRVTEWLWQMEIGGLKNE